MKQLYIFSIIFLTSINIYGQELNENAQLIKERHTNAYESNIKKYALLKWKDDFSMVLYEINKQSDALTSIIEIFKPSNTQILYKAILRWSREGKQTTNSAKFSQITSIDYRNLLLLECDWSMVEYEYEKQVKAKDAF